MISTAGKTKIFHRMDRRKIKPRKTDPWKPPSTAMILTSLACLLNGSTSKKLKTKVAGLQTVPKSWNYGYKRIDSAFLFYKKKKALTLENFRGLWKERVLPFEGFECVYYRTVFNSRLRKYIVATWHNGIVKGDYDVDPDRDPFFPS